jgi:hypothetical protein
LPFTPIVAPARSASSVALPGLTISESMAVRTLDGDHDEVGVVGSENSTTSLNEPPDANWASFSATSG